MGALKMTSPDNPSQLYSPRVAAAIAGGVLAAFFAVIVTVAAIDGSDADERAEVVSPEGPGEFQSNPPQQRAIGGGAGVLEVTADHYLDGVAAQFDEEGERRFFGPEPPYDRLEHTLGNDDLYWTVAVVLTADGDGFEYNPVPDGAFRAVASSGGSRRPLTVPWTGQVALLPNNLDGAHDDEAAAAIPWAAEPLRPTADGYRYCDPASERCSRLAVALVFPIPSASESVRLIYDDPGGDREVEFEFAVSNTFPPVPPTPREAPGG